MVLVFVLFGEEMFKLYEEILHYVIFIYSCLIKMQTIRLIDLLEFAINKFIFTRTNIILYSLRSKTNGCNQQPAFNIKQSVRCELSAGELCCSWWKSCNSSGCKEQQQFNSSTQLQYRRLCKCISD